MPPDLLAAILANPDDDLPRLVAADWYDEHGDPERAEFIRVQITISHVPKRQPGEFHRDELAGKTREKVLLHRHFDRWLEPFRLRGEPLYHVSSHGEFQRGFIEAVWMHAASFLKRGEMLFDRFPLQTLRITKASEDEMLQLISFPPTKRLRTLDLSGRRFRRSMADRMARESTLPHLRELILRNCSLSDDVAIALAEAKFPRPLQKIDIAGNSLTDRGIEALLTRFGNAVRFG